MSGDLKKIVKPAYNFGKELWYGTTGFFYVSQ